MKMLLRRTMRSCPLQEEYRLSHSPVTSPSPSPEIVLFVTCALAPARRTRKSALAPARQGSTLCVNGCPSKLPQLLTAIVFSIVTGPFVLIWSPALPSVRTRRSVIGEPSLAQRRSRPSEVLWRNVESSNTQFPVVAPVPNPSP